MGKESETVAHPPQSPFLAAELARCEANYQPLSPLSLLSRAARIHGEMPAVVHGKRTLTWAEVLERSVRLGRALWKNGIKPGDVVAVMAVNTPECYDTFFGVPMCGAVLNPLNTRLDAAAIRFILQHGGARAVIADREFSAVIKEAVAGLEQPPLLIDINDALYDGGGEALGVDYDAFLRQGDTTPFPPPPDEWQSIALNYTSGTTGNPKGVVYNHRGAWMIAVGNITAWEMPRHAPYVWTLPMFHCCGWCFPWTAAALAGVNHCMRKVNTDSIAAALAAGGRWMSGAPIVLSMLMEAVERVPLTTPAHYMVAAAPPPATVLHRADAMGIRVLHAYGLTEVYGPAVACDWKPSWNELSADDRTARRSRQGAPYLTMEGLMVADADDMQPFAAGGERMGEVMMRGNAVMQGYFKNPKATVAAFAGGWFHTGDLGVMEADNYICLKDRAKDVIISGGENISSIEVENALYRHPAVAGVAVVGKPHDKWGETPCAYIELKEGMTATAAEIIKYCRDNLAHFKCPTQVVFGKIPRTVTGKVQKFRLREGEIKRKHGE